MPKPSDRQQQASLALHAATRFHRLTCPTCDQDDTLIAREFTFYGIPAPRREGDVAIEVQLRCTHCHGRHWLRIVSVIGDEGEEHVKVCLGSDDHEADHHAWQTWLDTIEEEDPLT